MPTACCVAESQVVGERPVWSTRPTAEAGLAFLPPDFSLYPFSSLLPFCSSSPLLLCPPPLLPTLPTLPPPSLTQQRHDVYAPAV